MQHSELKKRVCGMIDEMAAELVGVSHEIHANPETAFQEVHAHKLLTDRLDAHGLNVTRGACGLDTAYISEFGTGAAQIGILSEYDALPGMAMLAVTISSPHPALGRRWHWPSLVMTCPAHSLSRHTGGRKRWRQGIDGAPTCF